MNFRRTWQRLAGLPKTLYFNLHYFDLRTALRLPVLVSHRVKLLEMRGSVELRGPIHRKMVEIGFDLPIIFDHDDTPAVWKVSGKVVFGDRVRLTHGAKIEVFPGAELSFGDHVAASICVTYIVRKSISFGAGTIISWDTLFMDSDHHPMTDAQGNVINPDEAIVVGCDVWFGCRVAVLRGARIADGCVVGAGAVVTRGTDEPRSLLMGNPARVVRKDLNWQRKPGSGRPMPDARQG
jgi:acetyltransferase-like isoleucine patch superfamily enzyme